MTTPTPKGVGVVTLLGIEIKCLEERFETDDPAAVLLRAIKLAEPEMDNRRRALNTKMGMGIERAKAEGRYVCGKAPYDYHGSEIKRIGL
ncbi:MAG: hypothetical protein JSS62_02225 [Verrucomicrobia bacterium]|nr:hypothetical protein [Verrucomicrobiota bacterium]